MKRILLAQILLALVHGSYAQYTDTIQHYVGLTSTGSFNETNDVGTWLLNNGLKMGIKKKSVALNLAGSWVYGTVDKTLTNNDFNTSFDCDVFKLWPHTYYWLLANYTSSFSLKINSQYQAGAGIAYTVIDHKHVQLNLSDGVVYDNSDIFLADSTRDVYSTGRNSFRVMFKCDTGILTVNGTTFLQNSFWLGSDYILKANISMSLKIKKWLSFTLAYSYNRFNRTKQENTLFTYGLTMEKYF